MFATELEALALRHPAIAEVAVIGVPASLAEDDIKICVSLKEGAAITPRRAGRTTWPRPAGLVWCRVT